MGAINFPLYVYLGNGVLWHSPNTEFTGSAYYINS